MEHRIEIDRSRPLHGGAANGHNRWHPGVAPVAAVDAGDVVTFELRDSRDRQLTRDSDHEDLLGTPDIAHPLTGPVEVRGARPGDVLELEVLGYETDDFGWTAIWPGSGFLGDLFERPFLARWELSGDLARSPELPGVAVPACVHAGVIGVAPSPELLESAREREAAIGAPHPPSSEHAWPPAAADGLRTYPPRENGGNMDVRDLGPGARLWLPVHVPGALLSVGDLHFAQGDGEVCVSAIETGGSVTLRVELRRDGLASRLPLLRGPAAPGARDVRDHRHPADRRRRPGRPRPQSGHAAGVARAAVLARARARPRARAGVRAHERGGRAARVRARRPAQRARVRRPAARSLRGGRRSPFVTAAPDLDECASRGP